MPTQPITNHSFRIKSLPSKLSLNKSSIGSWAWGIGFTFVIAAAGAGLSYLPGLSYLGPMAWAIILAVIYRQIWGYPERLHSGIQFSSQRLLRLAIVLFGLKLNMAVVLEQGASLLLRDAGTIVFSIAVTLLLAKWLKADFSLSLLLAIGTGVCGAAAIAAVAPILKAKEEDTAIGAGIIALVGTLFAIAYPLLFPFLGLSETEYGMWAGISLHEIAHVALAASPAGQDALAMGLLVKLGRVLLLVPLSFLLLYWMKRTGKAADGSKIAFPWFLLGFIAMSLVGSYVFGHYITVPQTVLDSVSAGTTYLLTMAMVGLGLKVSLNDLRSKAFRPLIAMLGASVLLSLLSTAAVRF